MSQLTVCTVSTAHTCVNSDYNCVEHVDYDVVISDMWPTYVTHIVCTEIMAHIVCTEIMAHIVWTEIVAHIVCT
jgi:hypothetical protein